jgi:hypothetical protein
VRLVASALLAHVAQILLWGAIAGAAMASILESAQHFGLSRLSLPFLLGTVLFSDRRWAMIFGFAIYLVGGWIFAAIYLLIFRAIGTASWWIGALLGGPHALFVLAVLLPWLPYFHPRVASELDGPAATSRIEPPGAFGLNYGRWTPLTTLLAHVCYGAILGAALTVKV